jgi:hypothetical protein
MINTKQKLEKWVLKLIKCPFCSYLGKGKTLHEQDNDKINHIKQEHPERVPYKL